jgi:hypothetical protein
MRARRQPEQDSIPIPTPTPTMIGRIGNHCLEATHEGARLFGSRLARTLRAIRCTPTTIGLVQKREEQLLRVLTELPKAFAKDLVLP